MEKYFVIHNSDGNTYVSELSKDELAKRPREHYYGEDIKFLEKIGETDTNYWNNRYLIIKGSIMVPTPKEVVTEYDI